MATVRVEASISMELRQLCQEKGINQWSQILTEALLKKLAIETQEKRFNANLAQQLHYDEAIRLISRVLLSESQNKPFRTSSIQFAKEHATKLNSIGYLTNAAELLKDAGEYLVINKRR